MTDPITDEELAIIYSAAALHIDGLQAIYEAGFAAGVESVTTKQEDSVFIG